MARILSFLLFLLPGFALACPASSLTYGGNLNVNNTLCEFVWNGTSATALASLGGASVNSPTFTGVPTAPTAASGTANSQIATTLFVANALASSTVDWTRPGTIGSNVPNTGSFTTLATSGLYSAAGNIVMTSSNPTLSLLGNVAGTSTIPSATLNMGQSQNNTSTTLNFNNNGVNSTSQINMEAGINAHNSINIGGYNPVIQINASLGNTSELLLDASDGTNLIQFNGGLSDTSEINYPTGSITSIVHNQINFGGANAYTYNSISMPGSNSTFTTDGSITAATLSISGTVSGTGFNTILAPYAKLASPTFTGTPTAPTQTTGDTSSAIATDNFVSNAVTSISVNWGAPGAIGSTTPNTGAFTGLSASGTVSGAGFTALLSPYAPLASPTFTGNPTAPTQISGDNSTNIATTAFVTQAVSGAGVNWSIPGTIGSTTPNTGAFTNLSASGTVSGSGFSSLLAPYATLASPALTGSPTAPTQVTGDNSIDISNDAFVQNNITAKFLSPGPIGSTTPNTGAFTNLSASGTVSGSGFGSLLAPYAPLASPALTGSPTAPTQTAGDTSTKIATDNFVSNAIAGATISWGSPGQIGLTTPNTGAFTSLSASGTVSGTGFTTLLAPYATLASPALTGSPTAPTQTAGDTSTDIATDAFVAAATPNLSSPGPIGNSTASTGTFTNLSSSGTVSGTGFTSLLAPYATLSSPALTGSPTAPTQTAGDSSTKIATDAFVIANAGSGSVNWSVPGTIGATTPNTGAFTTLSASSTVSGAGFTSYLASPPAIGGTTANTGTFTTATAALMNVSSTSGTSEINFPTASPASTNLINMVGGSSSTNEIIMSGSRNSSLSLNTTAAGITEIVGNAATITMTGATENIAFAVNGVTSTAEITFGTGTSAVQTDEIIFGSSNSFNNNLISMPSTNSNITTSGKITPSAAYGLIGDTTGVAVAAGSVGELDTASVASVSMTTATPATCSSISLTAGHYNISGTINFVPAATTTITDLIAAISSSTSLPTESSGQITDMNLPWATGALPSGNDTISTATVYNVTLTATTTYYLLGQASFGTSTMTCNGKISAIRIR